jgi:NADH-quinone oxidoreductase subunit D
MENRQLLVPTPGLEWESRTDPLGDTRMTLNMGPSHPSTHGVLRYELVLDGERIVDVEPDIGYLHTGMEKTMEKEKWQQVVTITCRMDYLNSNGNDLGYCLAVEKLLGVEVPPRAQALRVLLTELNRIASHLVWLGTSGLDSGAMSPVFYCFGSREKILDIYECISGARMHQSYIRIGGVQSDAPETFAPLVRQFLDEFPKFIDEMKRLLIGNRIFQMRTQGVGKISLEDAIDWGLSGPNTRACGLAWDVRKAEPYTGYETYDFNIPVYTEGDCFARFLVRIDEMYECVRICNQALERLKEPGPVVADHPKLELPPRDLMKQHIDVMIHHFLLASEGFTVPVGEVYQAIESARGEIGFYVISDGKERPWRVRVRAPSFVNLQAVPVMARGELISDLVLINSSIDPVLGDVDR